MSVLRVDGWEVKPGRADEVLAAAKEIKPKLIDHGASAVRLMRTALAARAPA